MTRLNLEQIVRGVNDLPALPHVALQIMRMVEDPNTSAQDINSVIIQDQSLTAKVLRLANSAFYGYPRRISTVTDAIILLGFNTVKSLVMAASVSEVMSREMAGYALAPGELWRHSQATAMTARLLARKVRYRNPDVAYIAGLLHDIGKVILNQYLQGAYKEVIQEMQQGRMDFVTAEHLILGFTHAEVGARVAEKWNLPPELVEPIAYHHNPQLAVNDERLTAIVHVADAICMMMGIGLGVDGMSYPLAQSALNVLNLKASEVEEMLETLTDVFVDDNSFLA